MPTFKLPEGPTLTQKEVLEILIKAKELGIVELKLPGFEFAFDPQLVGTDSDQEGLDPKLLAAIQGAVQQMAPASAPYSAPPGPGYPHYGPRAGNPFGQPYGGLGNCFTCGTPRVPSRFNGRPYCPECHLRKKEANFRRGGRWY